MTRLEYKGKLASDQIPVEAMLVDIGRIEKQKTDSNKTVDYSDVKQQTTSALGGDN